MAPTKLRQMSGEKDDTDDLIAELSKLMAADSRSDGNAARQSAPAVEPRPAAVPPNVVRIPGLATSAPVVEAPRAPSETFDFSHASQSASTGAPAWGERAGGKSSDTPDPFAGLFARPPAGGAPSASPAWQPAFPPADAADKAAPSSFDFDFGFNRERAAPMPSAKGAQVHVPAAAPAERPAVPPAAQKSAPPPVQAAPVPMPRPAPVASPSPAAAPASPVSTPAEAVHDPIADLIAAELGASVGQDRGAVEAINAAAAEPGPSRAGFAGLRPSVSPPSAAPAPVVAAPAAPAPVSPALRSVPSESDRFTTAPVFGLGNRPAGEAAAPNAPLDPMDEIENLIGEAVRVELNTPAPVAASRPAAPPVARPSLATPVVPPLNGQFAPRRTPGLREPQLEAPHTDFDDNGDETIRQAAEFDGAEIRDLGSNFADERPVRAPKQSRRAQRAEQRRAAREREALEERPSGSTFKQLVVPAIAGVILVAGGFGLYWAMGMGHRDGKVPVFAADASPAKTIPPKPADSAPHSVVMDELAGNTAAPTKETLVSRDQTAGTDAMQVAEQSGSGATAGTVGDASDGGLANRKVRTVTVRPDGTIVSGDDTVAGATQLPVDRPNVPTVPGMAVASTGATAPTPGANTLSLGDDGTAAAADQTASTTPDTTGAAAEPAADAALTDANAPIPLPRLSRSDLEATADTTGSSPANGSTPSSPVNAVVRSGSAKPMDLIGNLVNEASDGGTPAASEAAPRAATPAPVAASGGWAAHVQLASQQSEAAAQSSAASLQKRFGSLWGDAKLQIVKVDLSKGTYYRVVLPADSLQSAQQTCVAIKAGGGDCVAGNG